MKLRTHKGKCRICGKSYSQLYVTNWRSTCNWECNRELKRRSDRAWIKKHPGYMTAYNKKLWKEHKRRQRELGNA